jgi:glycosyltransferase involved in cell wall biosynthesis
MQTLAEAAVKMRERLDVKFFFVGHGCKKDNLQDFFSKNGCENVKMYDFLTGKDFEQAVAVASCCVVSLESGLKGMCAPSKFYSYLQGGKPVLVIVEEGSYLESEVADNQIGRAVHIGDVDALVNTIEMLAENRDECARMGERSLKLYNDQYEITIALDKYVDVVFRLINSNKE